jgi:hypothetical protein
MANHPPESPGTDGALTVAGSRGRLRQLQPQQPVEHSLIGTCHIYYLRPA